MKKYLGLFLLLSSAHASAQTMYCVQTSRDLISELYRDYPVQSTKDLAGASRQVLRQYFDSNLVQLLLREQKCAAKVHGQCNLDFNILSNSQDVADDVAIRVLEANEHQAKLKVGEQILNFKMRMENNCMRIQDIEYQEIGRLKQILSRK